MLKARRLIPSENQIGENLISQEQGKQKRIEILNTFPQNDYPVAVKKIMSKKKIDDTFKAVRIFLTPIGRFPYSMTPDGEYFFNWKGAKATVFYISTLLIFFSVICGYSGYLLLYLSHKHYHKKLSEYSGHNCSKLGTNFAIEDYQATEEMLKFISEKMVFIVVVIAIVLNVITQSFSAIFRGSQTAQFFNKSKDYGSRIGFKPSKSLKLTIALEIGFVVFFFIAMVVLFLIPEDAFPCFHSAGHFVRDTVKAIKIVTLKPFVKDPRNVGSKTEDCVVSFIILLFLSYVYTTYKVNIMFYSYICKSISSCFKAWNRRAKVYFANFPQKEAKMQQKVFQKRYLIEKLAADHFILLKLVRMTDDLFGPIITTYFFTQIVTICFTIYVIIDLGFSIMSMLAFMILLQTSVLLYIVTSNASNVHEEATKGFESLRTVKMKNLGFREDRVLEALLTSFRGPPVFLTGSKMFNINRQIILTIFSIIVTYFVVLFQMIRFWN